VGRCFAKWARRIATRIADYENAINEKTRVILRVHPSNFTVSGFTEKPIVEELVALGKRNRLPVVEDLGSGCLVDLSSVGSTNRRCGKASEAGFSLVLFSGDKMLGGPAGGHHHGEKGSGAESAPAPSVPGRCAWTN